MRPRKVAFISPCGWGNLGDAAIVDSLIHGVRRRIPDVHLVAFTLNPADTSWRHGIEAHTCAAFSLPSYPVLEPPVPVPGSQAGPAVDFENEAEEPSAERQVDRIRSLVRRMPVHGALRTALVVPSRLLREPAHRRKSRERLQGAELIVVAGGGQLDGVWGGPLGHPYTLWRWARLACANGTRFAVASVGTGTLSTLGRAFVLGALRRASYRSYRDETSRQLLRADGITLGDPIVPDLAFGLPVQPVAPLPKERLVVGISPMNYRHPDHWPERERAAYEGHVQSFGGLGALLLALGHEVVVFMTDRDHAAVRDTVAAMGDLKAAERSRLRVVETGTVPALLAVLGTLDLVVAARLHGVLIAQLAHLPVLAVAHERKVRTLMRDGGLERYCVEISDARPHVLAERLEAIAAERFHVAAQTAAYVAGCRGLVEAQFDSLFGQEG